MIRKVLTFSLIVSVAILASAPTFASGSGGGGYGNYPESSAPRDPYAEAYSRGKSQFKKRIICKTCPYPKGVHDSVTADMIAKRVRSGEFGLNEKQANDMMIFLQRRYGVTV
jgi:hypothetical protein